MKRILVACGLVLLLLYLMAGPARGKAPDPSCQIASGYVYAINLPTTYPVGLTYHSWPVGIGDGIPVGVDGTFSREWTYPAAYFWVRGHGPSLIKAGPQLNDYHVIAYCEVAA